MRYRQDLPPPLEPQKENLYTLARIAVLPAEILDLVLQYVDIKTLLFAQQVSRHWRDIITSSPQIQEALFFRPKTSGIVQYSWDWRDKHPSGFRPVTEPATIDVSSSTTRQEFTNITINPLLANEIHYLNVYDIFPRRGQRFVLPQLNAFLLHPTGSWRSMFLTQPPIASLVADTVDYSSNLRMGTDIRFTEANCTLGSLVDRMLEAKRLDASSPIAGQCVWHVMYASTLDADLLAFGDWIVKYVHGKLVPTPAKYRISSSEKLAHPLQPFFSPRPPHTVAHDMP